MTRTRPAKIGAVLQRSDWSATDGLTETGYGGPRSSPTPVKRACTTNAPLLLNAPRAVTRHKAGPCRVLFTRGRRHFAE